MQIVYVAGPITGMPEGNRPAFDLAAALLRKSGFQPVIPHDICPNAANWEDAMRSDIPVLCTCDAIALLPGHEKSRGARLEHAVARELGLRVIFMNLEPT
jgi:nucleoside 2-deoxyribosyltransferase